MTSSWILRNKAEVLDNWNKQRVLMHGHQGWNFRHGLCHIYMIYVYIWVVYSFCLFCCLFIIVTIQFVALYKHCKPKPKPSTYDPSPPHPPPPTPTIYVYIWVVYSFCLFCCLFIIVTIQFVALYKPCKPKPKPSTYDPSPPHPPPSTPTHPTPIPPHPTPPHTPTPTPPHPTPPPPPHPTPPTPTPPPAEIQNRYLDRSQSNKYAINMQIQTISVSK